MTESVINSDSTSWASGIYISENETEQMILQSRTVYGAPGGKR